MAAKKPEPTVSVTPVVAAHPTAQLMEFLRAHVPPAFVDIAGGDAAYIAIPVFQNGDMYRVLVRLRYRLKEGAVSWFYQLHRTDQIFDDAFKTAALTAQSMTALPLFYGTPE